MVKKIDGKIVAYQVKTRDEPQAEPAQQDAVVQMHETVLRPERLMGTTYKLKTPEHVSEHSLFITINDIVLNEGTVHETRRPFEIFINSKSLEHYQWIVALTRIISAVFRKGVMSPFWWRSCAPCSIPRAATGTRVSTYRPLSPKLAT